MISEQSRSAKAINAEGFQFGDAVVLAKGPRKFRRGIFLALNQDVKWATIRESTGFVTSHPVEWLCSDHLAKTTETSPNPMKQTGVDDTAHAGEPTKTPGDQFSPTSSDVAALAYEFWRRREGSPGSPEEDWLRAEQQIQHQRGPGSVA
jgi:Protein of unknown function (DUF2934)